MDTERDIATVLLTGGTGFVGKALLRHWMAEELAGRSVPQVVVLSREPLAFLERHGEFRDRSWLSFHVGDILDVSTLPRGRRFTHILHAAADSRLGPRLPPLDVYRQVADGTRNMLDHAVRVGARRFLFISSGAVYGSQPQHLESLPESWAGSPLLTDPRNAYGLAKRAAEHLCALYRHQFGLDTVVARCFSFVGPDLAVDVHYAIGNFIRDALWRDAITVHGDGTSVRSYLHQKDLAAWLCALLMVARAGTTYNVGSPRAVSIAELARLVRDCVSPGKSIRTLAISDASSPPSRYVPDVSLITAELGLGVTIPLDDAIMRTSEALCSMPQSGSSEWPPNRR